MRIAPISPISAAIQAQALAAVEGALTAGLTDNAAIEAAAKVHLGAQAAQTALVADTPDTPPSPSAPVDPARAAVDQAKGAAAASQASLAPMFADMAAALNAPSTPPQLRTALANVLSLRTPVGANFTGPQLQQAVAQSGVMLEAKLAAGTPPGRDLKAALLTLLQTLKALPAPPPSAAPAAPIRPLAQHAGLDPTTAEPPPTVPDPIHSAARPPPPLRDAPLRPQPAETSALPLMREGAVTKALWPSRQRLRWMWQELPASVGAYFAMKVTALPCCSVISFTPCLNSTCMSAMGSGSAWVKLISCCPRLHSPLLLSTGTRAAVMPFRIARISGSSRVGCMRW